MKSPNELSFLPEDYLERKARRRANALCAVLAVVVMGAIVSAFLLTDRSMKEVERRHADVDKAYTGAAHRIDQFNQMQSQQRKINHRFELASALVERVPRSNLLAEFTNSLPPGVSLLELGMESKAAAPKGPARDVSAAEKRKADKEARKKAKAGGAPAEKVAEVKVFDVKLKLTGVADTDVQVAQFISKLNGSKLVRDVNLLISDAFQGGDRTMRKFEIVMTLNPDAEVKEVSEPVKTAAVELER